MRINKELTTIQKVQIVGLIGLVLGAIYIGSKPKETAERKNFVKVCRFVTSDVLNNVSLGLYGVPVKIDDNRLRLACVDSYIKYKNTEEE